MFKTQVKLGSTNDPRISSAPFVGQYGTAGERGAFSALCITACAEAPDTPPDTPCRSPHRQAHARRSAARKVVDAAEGSVAVRRMVGEFLSGALYRDAFCGTARIYWLPTFLTRENESLPVIRPEEFISELEEREKAFPAEADEKLAETLQKLRNEGYLILLLTAGPADQWYRKIFL